MNDVNDGVEVSRQEKNSLSEKWCFALTRMSWLNFNDVFHFDAVGMKNVLSHKIIFDLQKLFFSCDIFLCWLLLT